MQYYSSIIMYHNTSIGFIYFTMFFFFVDKINISSYSSV